MTMMTMTAGTTEPLRLRHELKHQIAPQEDLVLTHRLRKLFPRDGHAGADGSYRVTSLYFDTPYDTALREKLDGVDRREKFRLRYYGASPAFLKLEKKYKVNGLCGKHSARLTLQEAERLLAGEDAFLLERGEPLLAELYHKLRGHAAAAQDGGVLRPGGLPVRPRKRPGDPGPKPAYLRGQCRLPLPRRVSPQTAGRGDRAGGQVRRISSRPGAPGGPDAGPAGRGLFKIRPVPTV